jgi:predicted nucleic acid-binding protein
MAVSTAYLADKSALARLRHPAVSAALEPLILQGLVATCGIIELEVLYSALGHADFVRTRRIRERAFPRIPMQESDFVRGMAIMEALAARSQHRAAGIPDLLIAAVAERAGLTVIHYDEDFDRIAGVTGQSVRWVAPRGSL